MNKINENKSQINSLPINIHIILGLKLQALNFLLITSINLLNLKRKSGSNFLHIYPLVFISKNVSMMTEEDEVSLVVESYHTTAFELGVLREQGGEETAYLYAYFGVEVVQDHLGDVLTGHRVMLDVLLKFNAGNLEHPQHALQMPHQQLIPLIIIPHHHNMRITKSPRMLIDLLQLHILPGVIVNIMKDHHQLLQIVVDLFGGVDAGCEQDFDGGALG